MSDDQTRVFSSGDGKLDRILRQPSLRIESLEEKVEERLKDTRPLWEGVQAQLVELRSGQEKLREEMQTSFRRLDYKFDMLNKQFSELYAEVYCVRCIATNSGVQTAFTG